MLARLNHQWGDGANVRFDGAGDFWAKEGGVVVGKERDGLGEGSGEGGKAVELYADYGYSYWVQRLLGDELHSEYLACEKLKSSRRSHKQREFLKARQREVEVLMPNVGEVQSAADVATREAYWAASRVKERLPDAEA